MHGLLFFAIKYYCIMERSDNMMYSILAKITHWHYLRMDRAFRDEVKFCGVIKKEKKFWKATKRFKYHLKRFTELSSKLDALK